MSVLEAILKVIGPVMAIVASIVGDHYLAKWITAFRVWFRKFAWAELQAAVDAEQRRLEAEWQDINSDRPDLKPKPKP